MPEIKNIFHKGIMNKDLDERLVPNGQFRDAMNIQVSTSEGADVGAVQNILGNIRVDGLDLDYPQTLFPDFKCVGAVADEKNDVLYWFITSWDTDAIIEYHNNGTVQPILVDKNVNTSDAVLKFDRNNIITGINVIDDLLFWTDDVNEPKKINITILKNNSHTDLLTHSSMYVNGNIIGFITEDHITVIRKRPQKAPTVVFKEVALQEVYPMQSQTTNISVQPDPITGINHGLNLFNFIEGTESTDPQFTTSRAATVFTLDGNPYILDDIILLLQDGSIGTLPGAYDVKIQITSTPTPIQTIIGNVTIGWNFEFIVLEISGTYDDLWVGFNAQKVVDVNTIFEKELIRFGTRWKYIDGEYSAFSPFTQPIFLSGAFGFHPTKDPYNLGMVNNTISLRLQDLIPTDVPDDIIQLDILFKKERSTTIYSIDSIKRDDPVPNNWNKNTYAQRTILGENYPSVGTTATTDHIPATVWGGYEYKGEYNITVENIYAALPDNQMLRPWDNVPRKALAQEITANRIVYGNYLQNYNLKDQWNNVVKPMIKVNQEERNFNNSPLSYTNNIGKKSIKSLRNYYLGVVYGDEYGRETPVFTSKDATIKIPFDFDTTPGFNGAADKSLRLTTSLHGAQPDWAYYFKYFIKQTTGEYYNLTMDRVYKADSDDNLWISFPSSDRNKIVEGDYFAIKKQVDIESIIPVENNIKIIDIKNEAPETIKYNFVSLGTGGGDITNLQGDSGIWPNLSQHPAQNVRSLQMNIQTWIDVENGSSLEALSKSDRLALQFSITESGNIIRSKKYFVSGFSIDTTPGPVGADDGYYNFILRETIREEDNWVEDSPGVLNAAKNMTTTIYKLEQKDAVEFEGRFFVKIISSPVTQTYLLPSASDVYNFQVLAQMLMFNLADSVSIMGSGTQGIYNTEGPPPLYNLDVPTYAPVHTYASGSGSQTSIHNWDWAEFDSTNTEGKGWFLDNLAFVATQKYGTHDPRHSGRMIKGNGYSAPVGSQYVNGMEGLVSPVIATDAAGNLDISGGPYNTVGGAPNGPRHWSSKVLDLTNNLPDNAGANIAYLGGADYSDSPYIPVGTHDYSISGTFPGVGSGKGVDGGHWIHLSFMAPGEDLHDNDFSQVDTLFDVFDAGGGSGFQYKPTGDQEMIEMFFHNGAAGKLIGDALFGNIYPSNCWLDGYLAPPPGGQDHKWGFQYPGMTPWWNGGDVNATTNYGWNNWDPGFNNQSAAAVVAQLHTGSKFQLVNDDSNEIYTIKRVDKVLLYNYIAWNYVPTVGPNGAADVPLPNSPVTTYTQWQHDSISYRIQDWIQGTGWGSPVEYAKLKQSIYEFGRAKNRRTCYILQIDKDPTNSLINQQNNATGTPVQFPQSADVDNYQVLRFVDNYIEPGQNTLPISPAIFETEAKEDVDLNIYYEASDALPVKLDSDLTSLKGHLLGPVGSKVSCNIAFSLPNFAIANASNPGWDFFTRVAGWEGDIVELNSPGLTVQGTSNLATQTTVYAGSKLTFWREDESYTTAEILSVEEISGLYVTKVRLKPDTHQEKVGLPYYNCFSFGNGVESNRIRDDYNESYILNGVKASTVLEEPYEEERRKYGLIYSGIYNTISGVNNLNQFIQAEKITKDLMPSYGSIQKLYARDKDLITLCEDKIIRVYVDKDILYNADGNTQLLATNRVLGTAEPFRGNFGISKNPESFAAESFRVYFTDKQRGAVIRLSMDGLTPISNAGMHDYFRDILPTCDTLLGSYDAHKENYNLTMFPKPFLSNPKPVSSSPGPVVYGCTDIYAINYDPNATVDDGSCMYSPDGCTDKDASNYNPNAVVDDGSCEYLDNFTVSFNETSKGWVSFKSFVPEFALSSVNQYYTINNGELWKHHQETIPETRNHFYGTFTESSITPILNKEPAIVKHFNTLNYEGSQSKWDQHLTDGEYYNLYEDTPGLGYVSGWYVEEIHTDKQEGSLNEFIEKEGKWFNYIKGKCREEDRIVGRDTAAFNFQGLGLIGVVDPAGQWGCTDPIATNYDPLATIDDGSCTYGQVCLSCGEGSADNTTPGCCDPSALNWNSNATCDDGSCVYVPVVITSHEFENCKTGNKMIFGDCTGIYNGTQGGAGEEASTNHFNLINTNVGTLNVGDILSFTPPTNANPGVCIAFSASPFNDLGEEPCFKYLGTTTTFVPFCGWSYCDVLWIDMANISVFMSMGWTIHADCSTCNIPSDVYGCTDPAASNYDPLATIDDGSCTYPDYGCTDPVALNYDPLATIDDGSCIYPVYGCMDVTACNYDPLANTDDGSCLTNYGCTDPLATNYNASATCDDGSCTYPVYGCTDMTACNYDPLATIDDGSCILPDGCTDPLATNYDASAVCDDGSCTYLVTPSWNCVGGNCINPGTGNGTYASLAACQASQACIPQVDPCTPIIASLDATLEVISSFPPGNSTAEIIFTGTPLPQGATISYKWYVGTIANHVTDPSSGISTGVFLNPGQFQYPATSQPILPWGPNGESIIHSNGGSLGLPNTPGNYHVSVSTVDLDGNSCYRWFEFDIII